jgi:hypothetical protein
MKTFKRLDEDTVLVEGVYYTTNPTKKTEIYGTSGFVIDMIKVNGVPYYPYKEEKK